MSDEGCGKVLRDSRDTGKISNVLKPGPYTRFNERTSTVPQLTSDHFSAPGAGHICTSGHLLSASRIRRRLGSPRRRTV